LTLIVAGLASSIRMLTSGNLFETGLFLRVVKKLFDICLTLLVFVFKHWTFYNKTSYYEIPDTSGMKYCEYKYDILVTSIVIENKSPWEVLEISFMRLVSLPAHGLSFLAQYDIVVFINIIQMFTFLCDWMDDVFRIALCCHNIFNGNVYLIIILKGKLPLLVMDILNVLTQSTV